MLEYVFVLSVSFRSAMDRFTFASSGVCLGSQLGHVGVSWGRFGVFDVCANILASSGLARAGQGNARYTKLNEITQIKRR